MQKFTEHANLSLNTFKETRKQQKAEKNLPNKNKRKFKEINY